MDVLHCNCGVVIGWIVEVNGQRWLRVGTMELQYAHGRCTCCGGIYHFDSRDYLLEQLLSRLKRARMESTE
jgi:hypothetical protein